MERQVRELGDRVPVNEKARAEQLIGEIRELVKNNSTDLAKMRQLTGDLQQIASGLVSTAYSRAAEAGSQGGGGDTNGASGGDVEEVIDAEFKKA